MRRGTAILFLLSLIVLVSCARVPETNQQIVVLANGDALRKDAAEYAKLYGVSPEEALRRLKLQREIGKLDAKIAKGEPDTYAGLWIRHKPSYGVEINMAGDLGVVSKYTSGTSFANIIETHRVEKSLRQLELEQAEAITTLNGLAIPSQSDVSVPNNQVEVYVLDEQKVESLLATGRSAAAATLYDVNVIEVKGLGQDAANAYAGNAITDCTAGYSVYDSFGLYGISTAGHCSNTQSYGTTNLGYVTEWWRGSFDVQWHVPKYANSGLLFKPWARDNQPTSQGTAYYREMYSVVNRPDQAIGLFVCKYGRRTGFTCGEISSRSFDPNTTQNKTATFIRLNKVGPYILSEQGDSGGPVYEGHAAIGITKGGWHSGTDCSPADCGDMWYMAINYLTDTGLRIHLAPR